MRQRANRWTALLLALLLSLGLFTACESQPVSSPQAATETASDAGTDVSEDASALVSDGDAAALPAAAVERFDPSQLPAYSGEAFTAVHDNLPYFSEADLTTAAYERYSPLDWLGRCGVATACVGLETMPTEDRGSIGQVKPSGWQTVRYEGVDGGYLYNRCHLIGFQLTGENANAQNLITGTRWLNIEGMLPFENMVADYVKETANHVLYRVTPVFSGNDLVARGVLMEGYSVEDQGAGICYCVYAYNVQPGITIDYATGESWQAAAEENAATATQPAQAEQAQTYVLNDNSKKFHDPSCASVASIKTPRQVTTTRQTLIDQGYSPCGNCQP